MIIMQGPSGSGKSTMAKLLAKEMNALVFSTDDFFYDENGNYNFDSKKLPEFHQRNQERAREALKQGRNVIIDNTNILCWQAKPYVKMAIEAGITPVFIRCVGTFKNVHGVPENKVEDMRQQMEELTVESCLNSFAPWEKE